MSQILQRKKGINFNNVERGLIHESLIALSLATLSAMVIIQFCLILRAQLTLEYAAHEAARIGALNNGSPMSLPLDPTKITVTGGSLKNVVANNVIKQVWSAANRAGAWDGLVAGMRPLYVANGTEAADTGGTYFKAYGDLLKSSCIEYLNPTQQSFTDWGFMEFHGENQFVLQIPNDTLRYRKTGIYDGESRVSSREGNVYSSENDGKLRGSKSGKTLAEVNTLHLRVNYGYKPTIPIVNKIILLGYKTFVGSARILNAFENEMLDSGKLPLAAEGVVGMQTPIFWHPFYSFAPKTFDFDTLPNVDVNLSDTVAVFNLPAAYMTSVTNYITNGINSVLSDAAGSLMDGTKSLGNGMPFCPGAWLNDLDP